MKCGILIFSTPAIFWWLLLVLQAPLIGWHTPIMVCGLAGILGLGLYVSDVGFRNRYSKLLMKALLLVGTGTAFSGILFVFALIANNFLTESLEALYYYVLPLLFSLAGGLKALEQIDRKEISDDGT